jgi:hypothetical protein
MFWAFWEIAKSLFVSLIGNRFGQMAIVAAVSWFWSAHQTNVKWQIQIAAEKAAAEAQYKAEIARQEQLARDIAEAATKRAQDDALAADDMRKVIDEYEAKLAEKPTVVYKESGKVSCTIDDNFTSFVRKLDASARKTGSSRKAR